MARSLVLSALLLCAAAPLSLAGSDGEYAVRGYQLSGELLLYPAADMNLPAGWSLEHEARRPGHAATAALEGQGELTTAGADLFTLFSQPMKTGAGQLVLRAPDGRRFGLGDLALAFVEGEWTLASHSEAFTGKPGLELVRGSRSFLVRSADEFAITGELVLAGPLADELGLELDPSRPALVGHLTLLGSGHFGGPRPIDPGAATPAGGTLNMGGGPDVIVSTVGSALTINGDLGGISAFSVATTSCNIGNANAIWIDCTNGGPNCNQHPVIGTQAYRLEPSGQGYDTFEQLGMSWLKHGFCAADAPSCPGGTYQSASGCDWLGLFATDTYSSSLNGSQSRLGPRSEIQPWTGVYPYPYVIGWNQTGNSIYKRCQVATADIDPNLHPNARFWFEVVYITTDESLDSIRHNNYSVREAIIDTPSGNSWDMDFIGSTLQQATALDAWAQVDSNVSVQTVDVPNDGQFQLASRVTDLGGGQFHYEYALLNLNSDRSGQALSVPLGSGSSATNLGFRDVDYHSGETYASTDWAPTMTPGSSVAWATETHAQNADANALRWSTTYSYRFDSAAAPVPGVVTVTLFKPGSPTTIDIPAEVPGDSCSAVVSYCTSGTTTNNCRATISASGTASASASSGFVVQVTGVEGNKQGILYFGTSGRVFAPWGNGTSFRCVKAPGNRTGNRFGGGTAGQCDGVFSMDFNAWMTANSGRAPLAGQTVNMQGWFRDPPAPRTTNLSDAIEFVICP